MNDETQNDTTTETTPESTTPAEATPTEHMIPKSRFDEINKRNKDLAERLEAIEKERKDAEIANLAADNKWEELYKQTVSTVEPLQEQAEQAERFRSALLANNESRLSRIPEDKQNRIPPIEDPIIMGQWLDNNVDLFTLPIVPTAPKLDGSAGGSRSVGEIVKLSSDEVEMARKFDMTPEQYAQQKANTNNSVK